MAFFGLTALGPQNCFASNSRHITHLMVFEDYGKTLLLFFFLIIK
jgi:hypothetical protein